MATRLVNAVRSSIASALQAHTFGDRCDAYAVEHARVAKLIYRNCYSKPIVDKMNALPDGWMRVANYITAQSAGDIYDRYYFGGHYEPWMRKATQTKTPDVWLRIQSDLTSTVIITDVDVMAAMVDLERSKQLLFEEWKAADIRIHATLSKFLTVEKLVEAWPEIAPFIPKASAPPPALPALPVAALNEMFKLPACES